MSKLDEAARAAFAVSAILALALAGCSEPEDEIGPTATLVSPTVEFDISTPTASSPPTAEPTLRPPTPSGSTPSPVIPTPSPIVEVEATVKATTVPAEITPTPTVPPPQATVRPVESATATAVPSKGGVLRLTTRSNISHQDVHFETSPALSTWGPGLAYSRLLRFETGPDVSLPSLAVTCDLCESWRVIDPVTFEFTLRDDIEWHDAELVQGRHLTADDLVYSFTRQGEGPNASLLGSIEEISAPGGKTVSISLIEPDADFMLGLADARSKIVAREAVELAGDLRDGPTVGTGPWRLTSTGRAGLHVFESFRDNRADDLPHVDILQVHVIDDPRTRDAAFAVGQIDVVEMTPFEWEVLRERASEARAVLVPDTGSGMEIGLNPARAPFDDLQVRQAAFAAMDPARALGEAWLGAGYLSFGFPLVGPDWVLEEAEWLERFASPERARNILAGSSPAPVTITVGRYGEPYTRHADIVAGELRAVGFDVTVEEVTRLAFADAVWKGGDYQMFVGPIPPVTSPNAFLFSVVYSRGPYYHGGPRDGELDALIEFQAGEYDPDSRRSMHLDIQRRMLSSAIRFMPATNVTVWAIQPWVKNLHINVAGLEYGHWASVWLEG